MFHLFMHSLVASCTCPDRPDKDRTCKLGTSGRCSNQLSELAGASSYFLAGGFLQRDDPAADSRGPGSLPPSGTCSRPQRNFLDRKETGPGAKQQSCGPQVGALQGHGSHWLEQEGLRTGPPVLTGLHGKQPLLEYAEQQGEGPCLRRKGRG